MHQALIRILVLVFLPALVHAQNKEINGLKTGRWKQAHYTGLWEDRGRSFTEIGNYKVIPANSYEVIGYSSTNTERVYEVKYRNTTASVYVSGSSGDSISVKDSIWTVYYKNGSIKETAVWQNGLNHSTKNFDTAGNLTRHVYDDYDKNSTISLVYLNNKLYKKTVLPIAGYKDKSEVITTYYPDDELQVSNAELFFRLNFITDPDTTEEITLTSSKDLVIQSISAKRPFTTILDAKGMPATFPMTLRQNTHAKIKIRIAPTPLNYERFDTVTIVASGKEYLILIQGFAWHMSGENFAWDWGTIEGATPPYDTITSFRLSKSRDRYLIITKMGTVTSATITSPTGEKSRFDVDDLAKIDLLPFPAGTYTLSVYSCHKSGAMTMELVE